MIDPERLRTQFLSVLEASHLNEGSKKMLRHMERRMSRNLDPSDMVDPVVVLHHRLTLKAGTVPIFDTTWKMMQKTEEGSFLPDTIRRPKAIYPHLLYPDVMLLGSVFGNERVVEMTWRDVEQHQDCDDSIRRALARIFLWFAGPGLVPTPDTPAIVKDSAKNPMQLWRVEYIINSSEAYQKSGIALKKIGKLISQMAAKACVLGADPQTLRTLGNRAAAIHTEASKFDFSPAFAGIREATTLDDLISVSGLFPAATNPPKNIFW